MSKVSDVISVLKTGHSESKNISVGPYALYARSPSPSQRYLISFRFHGVFQDGGCLDRINLRTNATYHWDRNKMVEEN